MRKLLRTLVIATALAAVAAAQASVTLYYATSTGVPLTSLTAPTVGSSLTLSVFYTSTTAISGSEVFASYDTSTTAGPTATPINKLVSLTSPTAASGVDLEGVQNAGGFGTAGPSRPYGLDILSVSATTGDLPATATGMPLFTVSLNNLALAAGGSTTLSFNTASGPLYTTNFFDASANAVPVTVTPLTVTAQATPEPSAVAALGLGAVALLRRRKRA